MIPSRPVLLLVSCVLNVSAAQTAVTLERVDGIQPQAITDGSGKVHLLWYRGEPRAGDLLYAHRDANARGFSAPLQVNRQKGSALAIGTIRGGQMALGPGGRVHVVWNGRGTSDRHPGAPLFYTRLNNDGSAFAPERDLITYAAGLDGGSSVAADSSGNVHVVWHARQELDAEGEEKRMVFVTHSNDQGATFEREQPALKDPAGVCACCGLRAFADRAGSLYVLFRAASALTNRDEVLMVSHPARPFQVLLRDPWVSATCPMSSASLSQGKSSVLAAWETADQVYYARVDSRTGVVSRRIAPPGTGARKHPVVVQNTAGFVLLAWTEGTGWERGGAVAWQVFDADGKPTPDRGKADGVPAWSMAAAVAHADDSFTIFY